MKKITLSLVGILSFAFASSQSYCFDYKPLSENASKQLKTLDQPYAFFKSFGKFPFLSHYHPAKDEMTVVLCGTKKEGVPTLSKRPSDLLNLTPVRYKQFRFYCGQKVDNVYDGFRDTVIGGGLDSFLRMIKILPETGYRGTLLVDEYQKSVPMKFVVRNADDVTAICMYLQKNFAEKNVQPHAQKPVLAITFLDGTKELRADLNEFLSNYYEVVDSANPEVKRFFQYGHRMICKKSSRGEGLKTYTGETTAEMVFRDFEKLNEKFKLKNISALIAGSLMAWGIKEYVKKPITKQAKDKFNDVTGGLSDRTKELLMVGGLTALGTIIAYSILDYYSMEDAQKINLGDLNELELPVNEAAEEADAV